VVAAIEAEGGRALAIQADSADVEAVRKAVADTVAAFGGLDILVNNAGIMVRGMLDDYPVADFDRMIAVNVRAAFFGSQAAVQHMTHGGRIINIGSITADRSAFPGSSIYSMTKSAIAGMTRGLAHDLGPRGITINNVQPGPTLTDMNPRDGAHIETLKGMLPVRRLGTPDEVASLVAYIAGPESAFITGASLTMDGGYTI
jgi:3-oxoacyl-[acyl-carrier protein] reductase